jgi:hypothetical protein
MTQMFEYLKLRDNYAEKIWHDKAIWKHFFYKKKKKKKQYFKQGS